MTAGTLPAPRGILFDLGGTLLAEGGFDPEAGTERVLELAECNPHGLGASDVQRLVEALEEDLTPRRDRSELELSPWAVHRLVYEPLGITFSRSLAEIELEFWRASRSFSQEPGIARLLEELSEIGLPMGVVSNAAFTSGALAWELARHDLARFFAFVLSSADYVVRKPHPAFFRTAAAKLGRAPEHLWFVGDSLVHDVAGAATVGMTAVWYNPGTATSSGVEPDAEVHAWPEFAELVRAARRSPER